MLISNQVPDWRKNAAPGQTLSSIQPKTQMDTAPVVQLPQTAPANAPMQTYIRPAARDRWMASYLHYYTPKVVEDTARGAMSGNLTAMWLMMDLMEQTWPRLSKNLNELKDAVIDLEWNLQPYAPKGQKPSPEAQRRAVIIEQMLWDMKPDAAANENDFGDTLRDVLDAVGKGISVLEIDWEQKNISLDLKGVGSNKNAPGNANANPDSMGPQDLKVWKPRATRWVHPRYYGYPPYGVAQDRLMLNTMEVMASNPAAKFDEQWIEFPDNRFILSIIKQKTGHPLNASLLRILGMFWAAQNFTWEMFINLAQIFGQPIRWVTYDPTQKNLLPLVSQMLTNMGSSAWAALPEGTKMELHDAISNVQNNPQYVLIEKADEIADITILGQTLTTSQGSRGSQALGKVHKSVRDEKVQATAGRAGKILNQQFLPAICRLNFGDDSECPWLQPMPKEAKSSIENAQRDQIVLSSGADLPKQWYYERHGIPVPQEGEDVIKSPTAALAGAQDPDKPPGEPPINDNDTATARARGINTLDKLTDNVLEHATGVEARWLGVVKPVFMKLVAAAKSGEVSDAQFLETLRHAQRAFPELFDKMDKEHLAEAMEKAMGAAAVNGAVAGSMRRRAA